MTKTNSTSPLIETMGIGRVGFGNPLQNWNARTDGNSAIDGNRYRNMDLREAGGKQRETE